MMKTKKIIRPLTMPVELNEQVEKVAREASEVDLEWTEASVMRQAIRQGLPLLREHIRRHRTPLKAA